jgi:nucleotide-binding universal stress UspA family protein
VEHQQQEEERPKKRTVVVVGVDDSEHSYYALERTAAPRGVRGVAGGAELVVVHAKPPAGVLRRQLRRASCMCRAFFFFCLGSVSDYCAHHTHCSVMIVKRPKSKC